MVDARRVIGFHIADSKATPHVEIGHRVAEPPGQAEGIRHHRGQVAMGLKLEDLRSDVGMQTGQSRPGLSDQLLQHRLQQVWIEAELAVQMSGADVFVRVALDARGEAQHQACRFAACWHQLLQPLEVVLVVHHDRHVVVVGEQQFLIALVVAMQHHPPTGHAPLKRREQLTGGDGVQSQPLGRSDAAHQQRAVGLGGVDRQRLSRVVPLKGVPVGAAGAAQGHLIEDIQRCPVTLRQFAQQAAANEKPVLIIQLRGEGREIAVGAARIPGRFVGPCAGDGLSQNGPA